MRIRKSAEDRKSEIEQTALDLAFKIGPSQVTTGMIAKELGLTQPAIYRHYPKKDDIWSAIALHLGARIDENIAASSAPNLAPMDRLRKLVLGHLRVVKENPALPDFMVLRDKTDGHIVVQDSIQDAMGAFRKALVSNVKTAIDAGHFRADLDENDAATLIFGVIQSLVLRMMVTRKPAILMQDGPRLLDLQLAGFAPTGENP
ncbi:TetR/AcrR family transcriptional regulator [Profundibacter sp.]|uniref:TetR/AcrR family transcriptional regulator n=1 Tax=Profundibacter sp. TaxID=3101071 RepID=UPI003D0C0E7D